MSNRPVISVIIPVYNVENYLDKCIESILVQDYCNLELILIDDGSKDSSGQICDKWASKNSKIRVAHIPNSGQAAVRNMGLEMAKGELVMFVDSDDFWNTDDKQALSRLVEKYFQDSKLDFVIFNYSQYYQADRQIRPSIEYPSSDSKVSIYKWFMQTGHYPMMAWNKIIRKSFLADNDIKFIAGIQSEDIPWFCEMLVKTKEFAICNDNLYVYRRQVSKSITKGFSYKKLDDLLFVSDRIADYMHSSTDSTLNETFRSFAAYEYVICMHLYPSIPDKHRKSEYRKWFINHKSMLRGAKSRKERLAKMCLLFLGFDLTAMLLKLYVKKIVTR